jgi:thiaminase
MDEIVFSAKIICYIGSESELHLSYCAEWGIDATILASMEEARANLAYTRFTLDCGMSGDLLDLHVALAPCLFGYGEVGMRLFNEPTTKRDSPYWKWILSYSSDNYQKACREGEQLLDRLADEYGVWHAPSRIKTLEHTFKTATKLEIGFWNMGYNVEW